MKTKNKFFVIILGMVTMLSFAKSNLALAGFPVIQWNGCRGGSTGTNSPTPNIDNASCIQQTTDGGYVVIGSMNSVDGDNLGNLGGLHVFSNSTDVWVLRLDSLGNVLWHKCYGGFGIDGGRFIIQTKDGGFAFVATTNSTDGDILFGGSTYHGGSDVWLVKINSLGIMQWQKSLGGTGNEIPSCLVQSYDSGYVISAQTDLANGDVLFGGSTFHGGTNSDAWIVKLDKNGNILWQKSYGGIGIEITSSLIQTKDSCLVFAGSTNFAGGDILFGGSTFHNSTDAWVVKINSLGIMQWQKSLGGNNIDQALSIKQTFSGGYAINATTNSTNGDVTGLHGSARDVWFIKLTSLGNLYFQKCFGSSVNDQGSCIIQTADSGFVLANISALPSDGDPMFGGSTYNGGPADAWLIKLDSSGILKYQKCYGGLLTETVPWIIQTRDNGYVFETSTLSNITVPGCNPAQHFTGVSDIWIVKLMDPPPTLPIKLISFTGKLIDDKKHVQLNWRTASEINNAYFSIEKSLDGFNYQEIGQVSGAGNSNEYLDYAFFDTDPSLGIAYYRLSQTDFNGDKEAFPPIAITYFDPELVSSIEVYDLNGRKLNVSNVNMLSPGIYLFIFKDKKGGILERKKMVILNG